MVQILEDQPSFASQLLQSSMGTGRALGKELLGQHLENQSRRKFSDQYGLDLPEDARNEFYKEFAKNKAKNMFGGGVSDKDKTRLASALQGLETIKRQKERLDTGHLGSKVALVGTGRDWGSTFSGEGRKVRAGYEQAGKELIQLASTLPIRNKEEFLTLGEKLYDTTLSQEEISGILDEMESHVKDAISSISGGNQNSSMGSSSEKSKVKFDPNNPIHIERRNKVLRKTGNDRGKAAEVLSKEFYLE